jgi:hypothetical protein
VLAAVAGTVAGGAAWTGSVDAARLPAEAGCGLDLAKLTLTAAMLLGTVLFRRHDVGS